MSISTHNAREKGLVHLNENGPEGLFKARKIVNDRVPQTLYVDIKIGMNQLCHESP